MPTEKLLPQGEGQAKVMLISAGPDTIPQEVGHWYSPSKVAELLQVEREACINIMNSYKEKRMIEMRIRSRTMEEIGGQNG